MSILVVSVDQANASEHYTNTIGMKMVHIQRGHFMMGQDEGGDWDEQPVHKVTITQPFYMSETEVTVEQFRQFRPNFTVIEEHGPYVAGISWYDAMAFCAWLSKKEGKPYRLPTEAEWEYACRADHQTLLSRQKV
jgi:formylglycine-generating enzyme required for sulfatase activity